MRIAFLIATLAMTLKVGLAAHATVNEYQEQQADRFCQVEPKYCNPDWIKVSNLQSVPVVWAWLKWP